MSPRFLPLLLSVASVLTLGVVPQARGQTTATTDPVGMVQVALAADSDSYVYLPFKRTPEYAGMASAAPAADGVYDSGEAYTDSNGNGQHDAGEPFTDSNNTITLSGTPGFTANQYVYAAGTEPKHYYLLVVDGTKAGMFYTIVGNGTSTVTVDLAGDNISSAIASGTHLQIIPYDTLATIFPAGQGIVATTSYSQYYRQTEILIPNQGLVGINPATSASYFYYTGASGPGTGWRQAGNMSVLSDDTILYPDSYFIIRSKPGNNTSFAFTGTVEMSPLQVPLNVLAANTTQDNPVSLPVATAITLGESNLVTSGAFVGSPGHDAATRQDELLVWDNTVTGHNRPPTRSYYYYTGADAPGWYSELDSSTVRDSSVADSIFGSGGVIVVRKKGTALASTSFWSVTPPYVP